VLTCALNSRTRVLGPCALSGNRDLFYLQKRPTTWAYLRVAGAHLCMNRISSSSPRQISERDDLYPPVITGGQEIGLGSRNLRPRAEARSTGCAVSKERLGDWDGQMVV
jgi:hypothetical protein